MDMIQGTHLVKPDEELDDELIQYPLIDDNDIVLFGDHIGVPVAAHATAPDNLTPEVVMVGGTAYRVYDSSPETARKLQDFYGKRVDSAAFNAPCLSAPGVIPPWKPQKITADFMVKYKRGFVLNGTGTGKTRSSAWAAKILMDMGEIDRVLIMATLSTIDDTWVADIDKAVPGAKVAVAHGSPVKRLEAIQSDAPFVVTNHDFVMSRELEDAIKAEFGMLIVDEIGHSFRTWSSGSESTRSKRMMKLVNGPKPIPRVWGLTATPQSQGPYSVWNPARIVNSGYVHLESRSRFIDLTMNKIPGGTKMVPKAGIAPLIAACLTPSIRIPHGFMGTYSPTSMKVPPTRHFCPLTPQQQDALDSVRKEGKIQAAKEIAENGKISLPLRAQLVRTEMMIAAGALKIEYDDPAKDPVNLRFDCTPRLTKLLEIITGTPGKSLIFTSYSAPLAMLEEFLMAYHIQCGGDPKTPNFGVIQGSVSRTKRRKLLQAFQDPASPVRYILAQPLTMAHGVTATEGNKTVWWGPAPHADAFIQGNFRTDRSGQTRQCTVHEIVSTPSEATRFDGHLKRAQEQDLVLACTDKIL